MIRQRVESNRDDERTRSSQQDADRSQPSPQCRGGVASIQQAAGNQALQRHCQERGIQAKLTVNEPSDKYEKEAERVADTVMGMTEPKVGVDTQGQLPADRIQRMCPRCQRRHRQGKPLDCEECQAELQRREDGGNKGAKISSGVEQAAKVAGEPGTPLPEDTRSFFESRMREDFNDVRIHTGREADRAARSIGAQAFTFGKDVVFRSEAYRPSTREGKWLLAHELTHVIQQRKQGAPGERISRQATQGGTEGRSEKRQTRGYAAARGLGIKERVCSKPSTCELCCAEQLGEPSPNRSQPNPHECHYCAPPDSSKSWSIRVAGDCPKKVSVPPEHSTEWSCGAYVECDSAGTLPNPLCIMGGEGEPPCECQERKD